MSEVTKESADKEVVHPNSKTFVQPKPQVGSSRLKYYIHDSTEVFRLQLIGQLAEGDVAELSGCWRTAKSTLGSRRLILDLQGLEAVDNAGRLWLAGMAGEGAIYVPDSFLRNGLAGRKIAPPAVKQSVLAKVFSIIRGSRVVSAESSTPAP